MRFQKTSIAGVLLIDLEPRVDERGFFARSYCQEEFRAEGLDIDFVQENTSLSHKRGTLRGIHYQTAPHAEDKLASCFQGEIFDVAIDMRPSSSTYLKWQGFKLTAQNRKKLLIPKGIAHGFLTLTDETEVRYQVSSAYAPEAERGIRWDDPLIGIDWPIAPTTMSDKDANWPHLQPL